MSVLNIRIDEKIKEELKQVAKFRNETLSSLTLKAINEMLENEFDYKFAKTVIENRNKNEDLYPIENLYKKYEI